MITILAILKTASKSGISIALNGDNLKIEIEEGIVSPEQTDEILDEVRTYKQEIIGHLASPQHTEYHNGACILIGYSDRDTGRIVHDEISGYNAYTRYEVRADGKLYVFVPGGQLLQEQRDLIVKNRDALITYLTTPPNATGICRRGHEIQWRCTEYGLWVCACYYGAEALVSHKELVLVSSEPVPTLNGQTQHDHPLVEDHSSRNETDNTLAVTGQIGDTGSPSRARTKNAKKNDKPVRHAALDQSEDGYAIYTGAEYFPVALPTSIEQFILLYEEYHIDALWVMPRCEFSQNISWEYVANYDHTLYNVFPNEPLDESRNKKPAFLRVRRERRQGDPFRPEYFLIFSAHEDWLDSNRTWNLPTTQVLFNTIDYVGLEYAFPWWSPQNMGKKELTRIHEREHWEVPATILTDYLKSAISNCVQRPTWVRDRGLTQEQCEMTWLIGGDKNGQYLGGTRSLRLGTEQYTKVDKTAFDGETPGLWLARITNVRNTIFNSYQSFCPWIEGTMWLSTDLLVASRSAGIQCEILEGAIWEKYELFMDEWGKDIAGHRKVYRNTDQFPDEIALINASGSAKQSGNSFIGLLATPQKRPGRGMLYRPDWNILIIHKAIANFIYSILSRYKKQNILPVLIARGDTQWFVSNEPVIPGFFDYQYEQRGWKPIGKPVRMTTEIIEMFQTNEGKDVKANIAKATKIAEYLEQKAKEA